MNYQFLFGVLNMALGILIVKTKKKNLKSKWNLIYCKPRIKFKILILSSDPLFSESEASFKNQGVFWTGADNHGRSTEISALTSPVG